MADLPGLILEASFDQGVATWKKGGGAARCGGGAVNACLNRARLAGMPWPLPEGLDDATRSVTDTKSLSINSMRPGPPINEFG
jgi:hypothetical protein